MPETKRRLKVFLCHAHSDASAVRDLFRYLKREGVDAWLDKEKLLPGADWDLEIRKAVRASDVVAVCLSKNSDGAGYRQKEITIAIDTAMEKPEGEIYIIPVRLEVCDIPDRLRKWHSVDLFEDGGRKKLIQALRTRGERVGAALRRRRGAPPVLSSPKGQEAETIADSAISDKETLLVRFMELRKRLEVVLLSLASRNGLSGAQTIDFPNVLIFLRDTGSMETAEYFEIDELDKLHNEIVHAEADYKQELTPRIVNRLEEIVLLYENVDDDI